jgi:hypothetical protein
MKAGEEKIHNLSDDGSGSFLGAWLSRNLPWTTAMPRHFPACLCAATANLRALSHGLIHGIEPPTVFRTAIADVGAKIAGSRVELRIAQHKVCGRLAHLCAVE